jgi:hypothetical protein
VEIKEKKMDGKVDEGQSHSSRLRILVLIFE